MLEIKQNPQNGRTDYSFSMRAVNQQTGVEQSTEIQQPAAANAATTTKSRNACRKKTRTR